MSKYLTHRTHTRIFSKLCTALLLGGLLSCSQAPSDPNPGTVGTITPKAGALKADTDKKKDKKLTIKNKSSHDVTFDVAFSDGDDDTYSCSSNQTYVFDVGATASSLTLDSTSISSTTTTSVTLSDGSVVYVTWDGGNIIAVTDTAEMN